MSSGQGIPIPREMSAADILRRLTGAATLAAGALLYGQATAQPATLTMGGAGQVLVAGASAPAWSGIGLTFASGVLTIAGSAGGTPTSGQIFLGGGEGKFGAGVSCTMLTASGDITLNTASSGTSYAVVSVLGNIARFRRYGYADFYSALQVGNASYGISLGIDPFSVTGGQFYGDSKDFFFTRGVHFGCPNAGGTDWVWALRISGGAASNASHVLELTDTVASILGSAPGTPSSGEVLIGGGNYAGAGTVTTTSTADNSFLTAGGYRSIRSAGSGLILSGFVGAEGTARVTVNASGTISLGSGSASADCSLERSATGTMRFNGSDAGTTNVLNVFTIGHNSSGTAANGFGVGVALNAQTSTTANTLAGRLLAAWMDATHATRTSKASIEVVTSGTAAVAVEFDRPSAAGQTGMLLYDYDTNSVRRVTVGAADSGGSGYKLLRIAN